MTNEAKVLYSNQLAGYLEKTDNGYSFTYQQGYLESENPKPVAKLCH